MSENIRFGESATYGERYMPAMEITDPEKAKEWFEALVEYNLRRSAADGLPPRTREQAIKIEKANLGYFTGYYNEPGRAARVQHLFGCSHPIFGAADGDYGKVEGSARFALWNPGDPKLQDKKASWEEKP